MNVKIIKQQKSRQSYRATFCGYTDQAVNLHTLMGRNSKWVKTGSSMLNCSRIEFDLIILILKFNCSF